MLLCYRINRARHWALLSSRPALARPAAATFSSTSSTAKTGKRMPEKEIVAVLNRRGFSFPVDQSDLHALRGQAMLLEEGT